MDAGPQCLRNFFDVVAVYLAGFNTTAHRHAQHVKTALSSWRTGSIFALLTLKESNNIVVWVGHSELNIGSQSASQTLERFGRVQTDRHQPLLEFCERLLAQPLQDLGLVAEVQIDRPRRVLNLVSDFADGDLVVAFFNE